jgi:transglutaminase-like putative cysteine protease
MSGVQVAVLPGGTAPPAVAGPAAAAPRERIGIQATAFAALGLYGVARWDTLLAGGLGRLLGLLALSIALAVIGPILAERSRWLAGLAFLVGALVGLAIAGLPVNWVVHLRGAVSVQAIGDGLRALPQISVPYVGINQWVRLTLNLGAMVLLLDAALVLTFVPRRLGLVRRAGAALPLLALSVVPATALRPRSAYLEGILLFALLVIFLWGERLSSQRLGAVLGPCAAAAALAVVLTPALDSHHSWINYRKLAASLAPGGVETFDWNQSYGPLQWPETGQGVLEVQAKHPEYWKAENLDEFDGQGWVSAAAPVRVPWQTGISPASLARWTQTIQVTVDSMATNKVIAAGSADTPVGLPEGVEPGSSPGTWESQQRLRTGASYRIRVYEPHPSTAQLASAGAAYPAEIQRDYLMLELPEIPGLSGAAAAAYQGSGFQVEAVFPPFGQPDASAGAAASAAGLSVYAQAYSLAQRLKTGVSTPYEYVTRVERYLGHGYTYNQSPPSSRYPLESFLFVNKLGYCQHFAGAMALLLRMGGVPARVADGFTAGSYSSATRRWEVSDLEAHAWVEVWFPGYGWVRFDPTPRVDPALQQSSGPPNLAKQTSAKTVAPNRHHDVPGDLSASKGHPGHRAVRGSGIPAAVVGPLLFLALVVLLLLTRAREGQDPLTELTRAFARTGRPLEGRTTLSGLEHRLAGSPDAEAYVRALRLARFGPESRQGDEGVPSGHSLHGRRALRRALGNSLGPIGRVRAWWALPPRWRWPGPR